MLFLVSLTTSLGPKLTASLLNTILTDLNVVGNPLTVFKTGQ